MQTNINTQNQRQIGNLSVRSGMQVVRALCTEISLCSERICHLVWSLLRKIATAIYATGQSALATLNTGPAGTTAKRPSILNRLMAFVDADAHVPSLGTDPARRCGLIAS